MTGLVALGYICMASVMLAGTQAVTEGGVELYGQNVCTYQRWELVYTTRNVSYSCYEHVAIECEWCIGRRCREWMSCEVSSPSTCWTVERDCEYQREEYEYCCEGYEQYVRSNGRSACRENIMCGDDNGGCEHACYIGADGDHYCGCFDGYRLENDQHCEDINECAEGTDTCDHECENNAGGYYCRCPSGYKLELDGSCHEIDECALTSNRCEQRCVNTDGWFYCECNEGYDLVEGTKCTDINECSPNNTLQHACSHECLNYDGGYACLCPDERYEIAPDDKTCLLLGPDDERTPGPFDPYIAGDGDNASTSGMSPALGLIVGGVIGGVALLCLFAALLLLMRHFGIFTRPASPAGPVIVEAPVIIAGGAKGKEFGDSCRPLSQPNVYHGLSQPDEPPAYDDIGALNLPAYEGKQGAGLAFDNQGYLAGPGMRPDSIYDDVVYDNKVNASAPDYSNATPEGIYDNGEEDDPYDDHITIGATKETENNSDVPAINEILNARNKLKKTPKT